jgi:hypothetical protein
MTVAIVSRRQLSAINHTTPTMPLIDMAVLPTGKRRQQPYTYQGLEGGLHPGGATTPPAAHLAAGIAAGAAVEPLDSSGNPHVNGKIVVVANGMSNLRYEWCADEVEGQPCWSDSFAHRYAAYGSANPDVVLINGAVNVARIPWWTVPEGLWTADYNGISGVHTAGRLATAGVTAAQVQVIVMKNVMKPEVDTPMDVPTLPDPDAHAYHERDGLIECIEAAREVYPNLRQVFLLARIYAGNANPDPSVSTHPEPYAYEHGFAVRGVVENYISDPTLWVGWGPYFWAHGTTPRSDGVTWETADLEADGIHPTESDGVPKAAGLLFDFFSTSEFTPWFNA